MSKARTGFLQKFLAVKANEAIDGLVTLAVKWDPEGASQAQIDLMLSNLDTMGLAIAKAQDQIQVEQREYEVIQAAYNEKVAAATYIEGEIANIKEPSDARRMELEKALATLVEEAEDMAPDVDLEKDDVVQAQTILAGWSKAHAELAEKIRTTKQRTKRAQRTVTRAQQAEDRAKSQAAAAAQAAGLKRNTETLEVALGAMEQIATEAQHRAEAARLKTEALTRNESNSNPHIADALEKVRSAPASKASATSRLAALKARTGESHPAA